MSVALTSVASTSAPIEPFRAILEPAEWDNFRDTMAQASASLRGRRIWNLNSTAQGGGVAEMLDWQIPYQRGVGMDVRWLVLEADTSFFAFTKRLHSLLHGAPSQGSSISAAERRCYQETNARNAQTLAGQVSAGDVAIVHDPQPAGLIPRLVEAGVHVIWRCHIGVDEPNAVVRAAWRFLLPYVAAADASVFSRETYVWEGLDRSKVAIIPPAIDAFTPKNQELAPKITEAILHATGILGDEAGADPAFRTRDNRVVRVQRRTTLTPASPLPADVPLVVQLSRWDRLKDPIGVIKGFAAHVAPLVDARLVLAGPAVTSVIDDPEQSQVIDEVEASLRSLPEELRPRIYLARLPMDDADENAAIVNALQRHAKVVVQKSLAEGFGLTVAEAMWKGRPVVAGRVGGICDQIEDGKSGVLVDPTDLETFGTAVRRLLQNDDEAGRLGMAARNCVRQEFLAPRLLTQEARLIVSLLS